MEAGQLGGGGNPQGKYSVKSLKVLHIKLKLTVARVEVSIATTTKQQEMGIGTMWLHKLIGSESK